MRFLVGPFTRSRKLSAGHEMNRLSKVLRDPKGNVLIIVAACMPLLIGCAAIGVDTIQVTLAKRQLQRSADSAAMAGAHGIVAKEKASDAVDEDLQLNNSLVLSEPRVVENAPSVGPYAGDMRAARVVLTMKRDVPFISFFTGEPMLIRVESTAAAVPAGRYCIVSLESGNTTGVTFTGGGHVDLSCGVISNSTSSAAIALTGSSQVTASPVAAVGGVPPATSFVGATETLAGSPPAVDPYLRLPDPTPPAACNDAVTVEPGTSRTLSPGCYRGLTLKGTVTLQPGVYTIDRGPVLIESQAHVSGTGITLVMSSLTAATAPSSIGLFEIKGGATVQLTAPTSGDYEGVLLHMDSRAPLRTNYIRGSSTSELDGAFYLPSQTLSYEGSAGMKFQCVRLVSLRVMFAGNSGLENNCPTNRTNRDFVTALQVRLVT